MLIEDAWTGKVRDRLKAFEQDLLRSMKSDGWDGTEDETVVQWSFAGALFYSIIVITTIGKQRTTSSYIEYEHHIFTATAIRNVALSLIYSLAGSKRSNMAAT